MRTKTAFSFFLIVLSLFFVATTFAATLTLNSLGTLDTTGKLYSHWWYTANAFTFKGTADPSASVNVTIDANSNFVNADASGNWSYAASGLTEGDHQVHIESNGQMVGFTLTIGANVPAEVASSSATQLPVTGDFSVTLGLIVAGAALIGIGTLSRRYSK